MKFTLFLIIGGAAILLIGGYRLGPADYLDWWFPFQLIGALMALVGIGRPFRQKRTAGRS